MEQYVSDVAFTPAVKHLQEVKGSRGGYSKMDEKGGWRDTTSALIALIGSAGAVSAHQALANDADIDFGLDAPAVQVDGAGHDFFLDYDAYIDEGDFAETVDFVEEAGLLDNEFDAIDIN